MVAVGAAQARQGTLGRATQVLDAKLRKFEEKRLAGDLGTRPRARVFVMRCNEFIALYPDHPEIDWVKRAADKGVDGAAIMKALRAKVAAYKM